MVQKTQYANSNIVSKNRKERGRSIFRMGFRNDGIRVRNIFLQQNRNSSLDDQNTHFTITYTIGDKGEKISFTI